MASDPDRIERSRHWDGVYDKDPTQVSWYQAEPTMSLQLIDQLGVTPDVAAIDVGGGASQLVDALLARRFNDLSVLDVSSAALAAAGRRLGVTARRVHWLHHDLLRWTPTRRYGLWHDRAVFHFLVDQEDQEHYRRLLAAALDPGGAAIIGTFGPDGPSHCSGLPVARYGPHQFMAALDDSYEFVASREEEHTSPHGVVQPFVWVAFRRSVP